MMSIVLELECPVLGCKEGPGGAKWKSPLLLYEQAYKELDRHLLYNHPFGTMNKLVPKVSVGDNDPKIEGEVMQLFNSWELYYCLFIFLLFQIGTSFILRIIS